MRREVKRLLRIGATCTFAAAAGSATDAAVAVAEDRGDVAVAAVVGGAATGAAVAATVAGSVRGVAKGDVGVSGAGGADWGALGVDKVSAVWGGAR